ncbi:MAG: hypothetical protein KGS48_06980 [Bacteroidetes bacterium]|nr:hypothetical protein [Bacteroidota bacterium]
MKDIVFPVGNRSKWDVGIKIQMAYLIAAAKKRSLCQNCTKQKKTAAAYS